MTPVKVQISKFQVDKSCHLDFNVLQRFYTHERLLSESRLS
jgi:hypothetical protein